MPTVARSSGCGCVRSVWPGTLDDAGNQVRRPYHMHGSLAHESLSVSHCNIGTSSVRKNAFGTVHITHLEIFVLFDITCNLCRLFNK